MWSGDYERFCKEVDDSPECEQELTIDEKQNLIVGVKKLRKNDHELCYIFIKNYYKDDLKNTNDTILTQTLPYGAKKLKKSIRFDLEKLPTKLQKILIRYIDSIEV